MLSAQDAGAPEGLVVTDSDGNLYLVLEETLLPIAPPMADRALLGQFPVAEPLDAQLPGALFDEGELLVGPEGQLWWVSEGFRAVVSPVLLEDSEELLALEIGEEIDLSGAEERAVAALPSLPPAAPPSLPPGPVSLLGQSVLASDSFDDPLKGLLTETGEAFNFAVGYSDGEYFIRKVRADHSGSFAARAPPVFHDAVVAVDARLETGDLDMLAGLVCRRSGEPVSGYSFVVEAARQRFQVERLDRGTVVTLQGWTPSNAIRPGTQTNRLELRCVGNILSGTINGHSVFVLEDLTYPLGRWGVIGGGFFTTGEVRFDNLIITAP